MVTPDENGEIYESPSGITQYINDSGLDSDNKNKLIKEFVPKITSALTSKSVGKRNETSESLVRVQGTSDQIQASEKANSGGKSGDSVAVNSGNSFSETNIQQSFVSGDKQRPFANSWQ